MFLLNPIGPNDPRFPALLAEGPASDGVATSVGYEDSARNWDQWSVDFFTWGRQRSKLLGALNGKVEIISKPAFSSSWWAPLRTTLLPRSVS